MKFFVDTAEVNEIRELADIGLLDGVTTNPSLIAKSGRQFKEVIAEICSIVSGPVSAEVVSLDYAGMMREAAELRARIDNCTDASSLPELQRQLALLQQAIALRLEALRINGSL
mgnify:CR=1 FL=1